MNGYLLDTNIVTAYLKRHPGVRQRIRAAERAGRPVRLKAVSYDETKRGLLAIGAHQQLAACERLWRVLGIVMIDHPVLDKAAELYAMLRASGQLIEDADLLIAAIALVHAMTLVTNNTAHFTRIPGLQVEDWLLSCPSYGSLPQAVWVCTGGKIKGFHCFLFSGAPPLSCDPSIPTADASGHCPDLARGVSVWDDGAWAEGVPEAMAAPCAGSLLSLHTASPLGSMACVETTRLPSWGRQSNEGDTVVCSQTFSCHSMAQH